ncbi:MAG: DeoR/GlpR family DNA-binding transcription regulator, partial [Streptomyces sp.]
AMTECARSTWVLADPSKLTAADFPYWAAMPSGTGLLSTGAGDRLAAFTDARWSVRSAGTGETAARMS